MTAFTYRSAQSGALLAGLGFVIALETLVLHLWLASRHPVLAWSLTVSSLSVIAWLVADYRALGQGAVRIDGDVVNLRIGRRFTVHLPVTTVSSATRPSWRDLPTPGTPAASGYLSLMKPATPNVLLQLNAPVVVTLPGGLRRSAQQLGLCLDAPDEFLAALTASSNGRLS